MSKEKEDEIELLGQGSYGCVYKPGILCNGKTATKKYITKVQEKDISTQNEIEIGKKIMKIPNYSRYFSPILETCPLNLSHIDDKEMDKCLIYEKGTQFITNKMKYVGENTLHSGINKLINVYPKLFTRLVINSSMDLYKQFNILNENNIIHMDVKQDNIVLSDSTNKPVIIDFGLSFDIMKYTTNDVFFVYGYDYSPWCIDIIMMTYLVNKKGSEMTNWKETRVRSEDVKRVMSDFGNNNPIMQPMREKSDHLQKYKKECIEYFSQYVGKRSELLYKELLKNVKTWDIYAVNVMYYRIIHYYKLENEMREYINVLEEQIYIHPTKREDGKGMRSLIKEAYNITSLKESKKKVSKKLKMLTEKEKNKIQKDVQTEYVKEKEYSERHYKKYLERNV